IIGLDQEAYGKLKQLTGKVCTIQFIDTDFACQFFIADQYLHVSFNPVLPADVCIKGTPISLLHLTMSKDRHSFFTKKEIEIVGDVEFAEHLIQFVDQLEIDWEEYLSQCIGDIPAHTVGQLFVSLKKINKN